MNGVPNGPSRNPTRFVEDLNHAARAACVEPSAAAISSVLTPFEFQFCSKPVEFRTTTVTADEREVSFRFVDEGSHGEIWTRVREQFSLFGDPAGLMDATHRSFPIRAEGVDGDVRTGLRKVWAFLNAGYPIDRFLGLDHVPSSLMQVRDLIRDGIQYFSVVGTDHYNQTCNFYPVLSPGWASAALVQEIARKLGFAPIDPNWLSVASQSIAANFTLSWSSGRVERLAFYQPVLAFDQVPNDPILRRFAANCPVLASQRAYVRSFAYTHTEPYQKVEVDYDGGIIGVLLRCTQVPNIS